MSIHLCVLDIFEPLYGQTTLTLVWSDWISTHPSFNNNKTTTVYRPTIVKMISKSCLGLLALTANGALAANHRHAQRHLHAKKDIVYETTTTTTDITWETVTVDGNGNIIGGATEPTGAVEVGVSPSYPAVPTPAAPSTASTTSSTSVAVPTTSSASSTYVAPAPTTLVTSVAPSVADTYVADTFVTPAAAVAESPASSYVASSTVSSATAAASSAASSSGTGSGSKRGAAYNDASLVSVLLGSNSKLNWGYNWGQTSDDLSSSLEFVPMLWGNKEKFFDTWSANAQAAIDAGSTSLLSFNEPDNPEQSNIDAATAASWHQEHMNPFSGKAKIGAPSITNSNIAGESLDWFNSWVSACGGSCDYDFCPVHWYNTIEAGAEDLFDFVIKVSDTCGKPVWLTEFAPNVDNPTQDQISEFLTTVQDAFDNNSTFSFLERYAYFYVADGMLVSGGAATTSGNTFAFS